MPIRDRLRKTFGGKKKDGSGSAGSSLSSDPTHYTGRTDIEYYKPHEIPKSKYRGRVDPEHKDRLDAYSFADAFSQARRRSSQALSGIMSPGGTKSQSRRTSYAGKSIPGTPAPNELGNPLSRRPTLTNENIPAVRENSDDDTDVLNAGLSTTVATKEDIQDAPTIRLERKATESEHSSDSTTPANSYTYDQPFTVDELEKAMTRATLKGIEDAPIQSTIPIAAH